MRFSWSACVALAVAATAVAASESANGEGDPSLFAGTIAQSLAAVIVFLILFVVLSKFAWGPILKGLQDRERKIKEDLHRAETASREAASMLQEYQNKLAEGHAEAGRIIEQGKSDAQRIAAGLKEQAQKEIDQMRHRAQSEITTAKEQAITEIYSQAAELATTVAGRILQREINPTDHQQLIKESLDTLGSHSGR